MLCKLVERLERTGGPIRGTTPAPRTRAQATQNVRRALDALSRSGRFRKGRFEECTDDLEEALLQGRRKETLDFFAEIKKAYANRHA